MNTLLKKAFDEIIRLPEPEQESIASLILEELRVERGWDERFTASEDQLGQLIDLARDEVARGDFFPLDPSDRLTR